MASAREYGAAIFSPGLSEVLLIKHKEDDGWSFPFGNTNESDIHVVAAASAVRNLLGIDIGDKISRTHWIEIDFPQTGAPVRLYMALGIRPETVTPACAAGASAQWHPLRSILPPVNAIVRADQGAAGASGRLDADAGPEDGDTGGDLMLEAGIAPFLAKMKALLDKHPEWRISQLDPHLMRLIQEAITLPPPAAAQQLQQPPQGPPAPAADGGTQPEGQAIGSPVLAPAPGEGPPQSVGDGAQEAEGLQGPGGSPQRDGGQAQDQQQGIPGNQQQEGTGTATDVAGPNVVMVKVEAQEGEAGPVHDAAASAGLGRTEDVSEMDGAVAATAADDGARAEPAGTDGGNAASGDTGGWQGPRPQEHLVAYCRLHKLPEPCYSLVVKKSARRPLVTASCILPHLGVQVTPDMHVPGGIHAACQAAALAALLWLEGALPADGGEAVRVVPVGWPPLLSEARGESWEAAQMARRAGARRELDLVQREALLREMDKKRQRLVAEAEELERLMAALRGGDLVPEADLSRLTASLGLGGAAAGAIAGNGNGAAEGAAALTAQPSTGGTPAPDNSADGAALAGSVTVGMKALQFRSGSGSLPSSSGPAAGGGRGAGAGGGRAPGRAPGTKRPRDDSQTAGSSGTDGGAMPVKSVVMELKELCDRRRWPQPQYCYAGVPAGAAGAGVPATGAGATAVVMLPTVPGVCEFSSGPQANRKRAKEAAAAAALAQLSALGLK